MVGKTEAKLTIFLHQVSSPSWLLELTVNVKTTSETIFLSPGLEPLYWWFLNVWAQDSLQGCPTLWHAWATHQIYCCA